MPKISKLSKLEAPRGKSMKKMKQNAKNPQKAVKSPLKTLKTKKTFHLAPQKTKQYGKNPPKAGNSPLKTLKTKKTHHVASYSDKKQADQSPDHEQSAIESDADSENELKDHQAALNRLKDTDREFYDFLQANDSKLLDFNLSDGESDGEDAEKLHKTPAVEELEVASDEEDYGEEADEESAKKRQLTLKQIKLWQTELQKPQIKHNKVIVDVISAFSATLRSIAESPQPETTTKCTWRVQGSSVFNAMIQLCVLYLLPALKRHLWGSSATTRLAHHSKRFAKLKTALKDYLDDVHALLGVVASANILAVLLKHVHSLSSLLPSFPSLAKRFLKRCIHCWSRDSSEAGSEQVRVVAFLCVVRIVGGQRAHREMALKAMYGAYVRNATFMSVGTLAGVNFMRRSLVEVFLVDAQASYPLVFLYIRQLGITLRNSLVVNSGVKGKSRDVATWQYVNACRFFAALLAGSRDASLENLVYPFVQIVLGVLSAVGNVSDLLPMRLHLVEMLIDLGEARDVYIPVLPHLCDALFKLPTSNKHGSKGAKGSKTLAKHVNLSCLLRIKHAPGEVLIDAIYELLLRYLASRAHSLAFPDLALFVLRELKRFASAQKHAKLLQLAEKVRQNVRFVEEHRGVCVLTDKTRCAAAERRLQEAGPPLSVFYKQYCAVAEVRKRKQVTQNDQLAEYNLPAMVRRPTADGKRRRENEKEPERVVLFPSDSEDSEGEFSGLAEDSDSDEDMESDAIQVDFGPKNKEVSGKVSNDDDGDDDVDDIVQDIHDW